MRHQRIGNVMTGEVVRVGYGTPFKDVTELLAYHRISGLPVVDEDGKVIGVISETDLMARQAERSETRVPPDGVRGRARHADHRGHVRLPGLNRSARAAAAKARARTAGELMSAPAITVHADASIAEAARTMARRRIDRLPVVDEEDRLVGIVTRSDLLQVFLRPDREIRAEVIDEVLVRALWLAPSAIGVTVTDGVVTLEGRLERSSEIAIAVRMTGQVDGVVAVESHLTFRFDDAHTRPVDPVLHGVADVWLRKL